MNVVDVKLLSLSIYFSFLIDISCSEQCVKADTGGQYYIRAQQHTHSVTHKTLDCRLKKKTLQFNLCRAMFLPNKC